MIKRFNLATGRLVTSALDDETRRAFLGGVGLGMRLFASYPDTALPAFDRRVPFIITAGPLTATGFPGTNRSCFLSVSPLTGLINGSWLGGDFGQGFARTGTDALVLEEAAAQPSIVLLTADDVKLMPRPDLWGLTVSQTRAQLQKEYGSEMHAAVIGPAGERLVAMASVRGDEGHAAGRCGMGAAMGSKNIKGIVAIGSTKPEIADPAAFRRLMKQSNDYVRESQFLQEVQGPIGTNQLVRPVNGFEAWPTSNHQGRYFGTGELISGEHIVENYDTSRTSCPYCQVRCRLHVRFGDKKFDSPEFESLWALGSDNNNDDFPLIVEANELCNDLGVDTISTGNTVAFYREYTGSLADRSNILDLVRAIGCGEGVGELLGQGTRRASKTLGVDYAMQVKGLELAAYDPRKFTGMAISYSTANRGGDHSRAWTVGDELSGRDFSAEELAKMVAAYHDAGCVRDSLIMCTFLDGTLNPLYADVLTAVIGEQFTKEELAVTGERIYTIERAMNVERGLNASQDILPRRLLDGLVAPDKYYDGMSSYYGLRQWDADGRPSPKRLAELGLDDILTR